MTLNTYGPSRQCDGNEKQHNAYQAIYNQIKCGHTKLHNEQKNEVIRILFVHKNVRNEIKIKNLVRTSSMWPVGWPNRSLLDDNVVIRL